MRMDLAVTALHVSALLLWVGGVVSAFTASRGTKGDDHTRHYIAQTIFKWVARPAFLVAFLFGSIRLAMDWKYYLVATQFMHAKLALAFVAIVAHHFLGARIRKCTSGRTFRSPSSNVALVIFGLSCLATVFVVVARPM